MKTAFVLALALGLAGCDTLNSFGIGGEPALNRVDRGLQPNDRAGGL